MTKSLVAPLIRQRSQNSVLADCRHNICFPTPSQSLEAGNLLLNAKCGQKVFLGTTYSCTCRWPQPYTHGFRVDIATRGLPQRTGIVQNVLPVRSILRLAEYVTGKWQQGRFSLDEINLRPENLSFTCVFCYSYEAQYSSTIQHQRPLFKSVGYCRTPSPLERQVTNFP